MSKRNVFAIVIVLTVTLSVAAFAVQPAKTAAVQSGESVASLQLDLGLSFNPAECPQPDTCGTGGGG